MDLIDLEPLDPSCELEKTSFMGGDNFEKEETKYGTPCTE